MPYKPVAKRMLAGRISCSETAAAENGIAQITFDEYHCILPDYLENFISGISLRVEDKEHRSNDQFYMKVILTGMGYN